MVAGRPSRLWICPNFEIRAGKMGDHDQGLSVEKNQSDAYFYSD